MEQHEAQARMHEIQRIMERTTLYTNLPGAPAVIGGVLALVGCVVSRAMIGTANFADLLGLDVGAQVAFCVIWAALGMTAIAQDVILSTLAARDRGFSPLARPGRLAALSLTPSVFVATVLTVDFMCVGHFRYVAPVWMMCYGTGVYAAGLFSVRLPRLLGMAFIATGVVTLVWPAYSIALTALSFGVYHIVFGVTVIRRRKQDETE